jgi:hypothetical protein
VIFRIAAGSALGLPRPCRAAKKAKQKAADEAYQAAVKRIPDPKQKYDPWKIVR